MPDFFPKKRNVMVFDDLHANHMKTSPTKDHISTVAPVPESLLQTFPY
jgi:hypothetical protein